MATMKIPSPSSETACPVQKTEKSRIFSGWRNFGFNVLLQRSRTGRAPKASGADRKCVLRPAGACARDDTESGSEAQTDSRSSGLCEVTVLLDSVRNVLYLLA